MLYEVLGCAIVEELIPFLDIVLDWLFRISDNRMLRHEGFGETDLKILLFLIRYEFRIYRTQTLCSLHIAKDGWLLLEPIRRHFEEIVVLGDRWGVLMITPCLPSHIEVFFEVPTPSPGFELGPSWSDLLLLPFDLAAHRILIGIAVERPSFILECLIVRIRCNRGAKMVLMLVLLAQTQDSTPVRWVLHVRHYLSGVSNGQDLLLVVKASCWLLKGGGFLRKGGISNMGINDTLKAVYCFNSLGATYPRTNCCSIGRVTRTTFFFDRTCTWSHRCVLLFRPSSVSHRKPLIKVLDEHVLRITRPRLHQRLEMIVRDSKGGWCMSVNPSIASVAIS